MKKTSSGHFPGARFLPGTVKLFFLGLLAVGNFPARAASAPTLSFDVTASASTDGESAQNIKARVLLRGSKARVETRLGQQGAVILWLKPYVYRLLPASKSGVRYKTNNPFPELQMPGTDTAAMMSSPAKIRAAFTSRGARKTGSQVVGGVPTDIYSAKTWRTASGSVSDFKVWLRRSDALPVKMHSRSGQWKFDVVWRNYRRNVPLSPALFAVPKGYRIREGQAPRSAL